MRQIWTIGHSTLSAEEFEELLRSNRIERLADVRQFPGSRRHPQFSQKHLCESLKKAGIEYVHFLELGGRRKAQPHSPNTAWRNEAFRGYADYMQTTEFEIAIKRLLETAARKRTAIMCAEAVWWRCHRGLIADYLKIRGIEVLHIGSDGKTGTHPYTSAARIANGQLSYTGGQPDLPLSVSQST